MTERRFQTYVGSSKEKWYEGKIWNVPEHFCSRQEKTHNYQNKYAIDWKKCEMYLGLSNLAKTYYRIDKKIKESKKNMKSIWIFLLQAKKITMIKTNILQKWYESKTVNGKVKKWNVKKLQFFFLFLFRKQFALLLTSNHQKFGHLETHVTGECTCLGSRIATLTYCSPPSPCLPARKLPIIVFVCLNFGQINLGSSEV